LVVSKAKGRVVKLLAGFYFVHLDLNPEPTVLRCRARGRLKSLEETPAVGDLVEVEFIDRDEGVLTGILPRKNLLQRPTVANISQMVVMAAFASPPPNPLLLDRLLLTAEYLDLEVLLCFNKADLPTETEILPRQYKQIGYRVVEISAQEGSGLAPLYVELRGHVSVLAGQSGVGKSSLLNTLLPELELSVGDVSHKTQLGRHTTRHVELIHIREYDAYLVDTPGFSRLDLPEGLESLHLSEYFPEMRALRSECRFGHKCRHVSEPDCAVVTALQEGRISRLRYDNYLLLYEELCQRERSQYK
jgi:ribosome biogenesis GTPase